MADNVVNLFPEDKIILSESGFKFLMRPHDESIYKLDAVHDMLSEMLLSGMEPDINDLKSAIRYIKEVIDVLEKK